LSRTRSRRARGHPTTQMCFVLSSFCDRLLGPRPVYELFPDCLWFVIEVLRPFKEMALAFRKRGVSVRPPFLRFCVRYCSVLYVFVLVCSCIFFFLICFAARTHRVLLEFFHEKIPPCPYRFLGACRVLFFCDGRRFFFFSFSDGAEHQVRCPPSWEFPTFRRSAPSKHTCTLGPLLPLRWRFLRLMFFPLVPLSRRTVLRIGVGLLFPW